MKFSILFDKFSCTRDTVKYGKEKRGCKFIPIKKTEAISESVFLWYNKVDEKINKTR